MLKKSTILMVFLLPLFLLKTAGVVFANTQEVKIEAKQLDREAEILTNYFAQFDSPLQYHAQDFIDAANTYQIDWKLVPAIAGVESTFGKHVPGGLNASYNAWGWGVYKTQAIYFKSWREGIFTVSKGLKENYINKGLTDPYSMNRIYASSPTWGNRVSFFLSQLEEFEQEYSKLHSLRTEINPSVKIAALSGQLAYRVSN